MSLLLDSYGLENCGECWANAIDGRIRHHENCRLGNLQADADRRLELLGRCASVIDVYSPNHPLLEDIEKELADAKK